MKHTPGPWKADTKIVKQFDVNTGAPKEVTSSFVRYGEIGFPLACVVGDNPEIDAQLISLTPEMFEIIEYLGSGRERNPNIYVAMDKAMKIFDQMRLNRCPLADPIREVTNDVDES